MAKVFVVPDVHLKAWMFDDARKLLKSTQADFVVMLGDLVDDWYQGENLELYRQTLKSAVVFAKEFNALWCYGNHDLSYRWGLRESGYSQVARHTVAEGLELIEQSINEENCAYIHRIDNTLFSHAGLTRDFAEAFVSDIEMDIDDILWEINQLSENELWLDNSPIWARPQALYSEMELFPDEMFQVVGHTPVTRPEKIGNLLSLDTFSTRPDGSMIGDSRFVIVDSVDGSWKYADEC